MRDEADDGSRGRTAWQRNTRDFCRAARGSEQAGEHSQQRRLTCPVRPEQREAFAFSKVKREITDRGSAPELPSQRSGFYRGNRLTWSDYVRNLGGSSRLSRSGGGGHSRTLAVAATMRNGGPMIGPPLANDSGCGTSKGATARTARITQSVSSNRKSSIVSFSKLRTLSGGRRRRVANPRSFARF